MGIKDLFRSRPTVSSPDDLFDALLDAFERKDFERAMHLINGNSDSIRTNFKSWTKVPATLRGDAAAMARHVNTLVTVARAFEKAGDPSLRILLEGDGENPLTRWKDALEHADELIRSGEAAEAVVLLRATLDELSTETGSGADHFRPRVLGRLGMAFAKTGDISEAVRVTREALAICQQTGDDEGVTTYTANLLALGSYEVGTSPGDRRYSIVFTDSQGRTLLPEELAEVTDRFSWQVRDHGEVDPEARRLHEEGRVAGGKGEYDTAIALFTTAAVRDPAWPYPVYDRAFAHLLKQEFDAALVDYRKTLELSPLGYFVAATAADLLTREQEGEFPPGLYAAFAMLESMTAEQQQSVAAQLVEKFPSHAPAWHLHARFLQDPSDQLAAIERGLAARPDPDTRGSLLAQKALALHTKGESERAMEILTPLTASVGDSLASHAKAHIAAAVIRSARRR